MASTRLRRLDCLLWLLAPVALVGLQSLLPTALRAQTQAPVQHLECNLGYTLQECQVATVLLRKALAQYPVDSLGEWTWVLVRPQDWKRILSAKGFDPNDPAFSSLTKRKTFLDGSLLERASRRGMELRLKWHMPIEELLDLSIRHELAHALCNERNEIKAERVAMALRDGATLSCRGVLVGEDQHGRNKSGQLARR